MKTEVLVLGSGPGGYTAAFRAADLGLKTTLVERYGSLGGVCLNVGCIPSKALLHVADVVESVAALGENGVRYDGPSFDLKALLKWKQGVVDRMTGGLKSLAKRRKVTVVQGVGRFASPHELEVEGSEETQTIEFDHAIIAVGSRPARLPNIPHDDPRVMDSTKALELPEIPGSLLVIGGGIIGLELATVYHALGSAVTVAELTGALMPGTDPDLVKPLRRRIEKRYDGVYLETKVTGVEAAGDELRVTFDGPKAPKEATFDRILVSVGRKPNGDRINAEAAGLEVDDRGFISVDEQMRTNVGHIFAIGDVVGDPMLAHKASHEGKVAAEVVAGKASAFEGRLVPAVAYTDPEVAWVGLSEPEAKKRELRYGTGTFPWAASGRSLSLGRSEGLTKLIFDEETERVLGAGLVGPNAGELIAEATLAIEMGADARDLGLTIHPHPTLSETVGFAAEVFEGTVTDIYVPKKR